MITPTSNLELQHPFLFFTREIQQNYTHYLSNVFYKRKLCINATFRI